MDRGKAKDLLLRARQNIISAKKLIADSNCHDDCGYLLCQAAEKMLKSLCEIKNIEYSITGYSGHDLNSLMEKLENSNFNEISSHSDIVDLTIYGSNSRYEFTSSDDQLQLAKYLTKIEDLDLLVLTEYVKLKDE